MTKLRLGIVGISEGNGHPYSWSAIFNGYDPVAMANCPFPAIPEYLARRRFPDDAIGEGMVTHVWTQDRAISAQIAAASRIANIVERPEAMIGEIDALLLARDDAANHMEFAGPFLDAGLPVYIDKPMALSRADALALLARQKYPGQIYTCSALVHATEFRPSAADLASIGAIRRVEARTVKDWDRYAIHIIDPALRLLGRRQPPVEALVEGGKSRRLTLRWPDGVVARFEATGETKGDIIIVLVGDCGRMNMVFADAFSAFRGALAEFVGIALGRIPIQDSTSILEVVDIIELGRRIQ